MGQAHQAKGVLNITDCKNVIPGHSLVKNRLFNKPGACKLIRKSLIKMHGCLNVSENSSFFCYFVTPLTTIFTVSIQTGNPLAGTIHPDQTPLAAGHGT